MKSHQTSPNQYLGKVMKWMAFLFLVSGTSGHAQSLISSAEFFDPDFEARRPGAPGFLVLTVDTSPYTPASQTAGNVTWTHTAGGLVQVGLDLGADTADVQLAAYTQTLGDFLTFGRELEITTFGALPDGDLEALVNDVIGASAINSWSARADVANLNLSEGILYSVQFDVTTGAGINLNALSNVEFTLLNGVSPIANTSSIETLNLLDLLTLGTGSTTIDFQFYAPEGLTDLSFLFEADTVADVNLLGGITDNQIVLQFSNTTVTPIPEVSSMILASLGFLLILRRRRMSTPIWT